MSAGEIVGEPLIIHEVGTPPERRERVAALFERVGLRPEAMQLLSARILRRPAPAHRHRPRAGAQPRADRRRRAGLGARRVDPGADHQPADGPAGRVQALLPVRRPRPRGGRAHQPPRRGDVSRPHRRDDRQAAACSRCRCIPTPRRCCRRCRSPRRSARGRKRVILTGDVPSPINPPPGCHFHARCPYAMPRCQADVPALREVVPGHWAVVPPARRRREVSAGEAGWTPAARERSERRVSLSPMIGVELEADAHP